MDRNTAKALKIGDIVYWTYKSKGHNQTTPLIVVGFVDGLYKKNEVCVEDENGDIYSVHHRYVTLVSKATRRAQQIQQAIRLLERNGYVISEEEEGK